MQPLLVCICHTLHKKASACERLAVSLCARLFDLFSQPSLTSQLREKLTVLIAAVGAGPFQGVEVLGQQGQVGLRGALVVIRVWRLLHHLFNLLYNLNHTMSVDVFDRPSFLEISPTYSHSWG